MTGKRPPNKNSLANLKPYKKGQIANPMGKGGHSIDKLSRSFIAKLGESFNKHGEKTIEELRVNDPSAYIRVIAGLMPKNVVIDTKSQDILEDFSDDMLQKLSTLLDDRVGSTVVTEPKVIDVEVEIDE